MNAIVRETIKQWFPDSWEKALSDVDDQQNIELVLLDLIKQCMPAEDFELFSLVTKIQNDLIDEDKKPCAHSIQASRRSRQRYQYQKSFRVKIITWK